MVMKLKPKPTKPSAIEGMKQWVERTVLQALPVPDADLVHLCSEALLHGLDKLNIADEAQARMWVQAQVGRFVTAHGQSLRLMAEHSAEGDAKTTTTDDGVIVSANKYAPSVAEVDKAMEMVQRDRALLSGKVRVAG